MIGLDELYFEWLVTCIDDEATEGVAYLCDLLHGCEFHRRIGRDINRAIDGANLRKEFLNQLDAYDPYSSEIEDLMEEECSWLEMLIALSRSLDYLYDGGVAGRFMELLNNIGIGHLAVSNHRRPRIVRDYDKHLVQTVTSDINKNRIAANGHGGLFPLKKRNHPDQRRLEIWDQHSSYFNERLEGVMWTSTS